MRKPLLFSLIACFCLSMLAHSDEKAMPLQTLRVQVLDPDGNPAEGVRVYITSISRRTFIFFSEALKNEAYQFVTDGDGRFTVPFVRAETGSYPPDQSLPPFKYGAYYLVIPPSEGNGGAISDLIYHSAEGVNDPWIRQRKVNEQVFGERRIIYLSDEANELTLNIKKGVPFEGQIVDPDGKPITDIEVSLLHNMHAWSHTGAGGELWEMTARTVENGRFLFDHVYPATVDLHLNWQGTWLRTRFGDVGPWIEDIINLDIPLWKLEPLTSISIMGLPIRSSWRTYGTVTGPDGQPMTGIEVTVGISGHRHPQTWGDWHHFESAMTDTNGHYEIMSSSPWLRFIVARAEGYKETGVNLKDENEPITPGQYDLKMTPEKLKI